MADFDAIYQDQPGLEEGAAILDDTYTTFVPDPIIVRGAGNITVWVLFEYFFNDNLILQLLDRCQFFKYQDTTDLHF